ncbi:peroxiredoxin-like protein [Scopulibacillus darangshiensis]|uniref:Peroxiredoxin-like protein n=1 Tax=Scopulibacillus darangshiensis TaxID=442528 RepID=A0A4R2P562_9BACL|nr:OsmC family protein [Scopulibacillus darangshiensis]TCP29817.1 peroxiredoxin-like protein [Scopulibacillus darangshiensis]
MNYTFQLTGEWYGGRNGEGRIQTNGLNQDISIGAEMDGPGNGTNPDELLVSAVSSCYLMTLGIGLDAIEYPYKSIKLKSKGIVSSDPSLHFKEIVHFPTIILDSEADDDLREKAITAARKAEQNCMIAKALRGNVSISVEPSVEADKENSPIGEPLAKTEA